MQVFRLARVMLSIPIGTLAARAGISTREVGRIERGEVQPKPATIAALDAAFLEVLRARLDAGCGRVL